MIILFLRACKSVKVVCKINPHDRQSANLEVTNSMMKIILVGVMFTRIHFIL
jgi:hypothetical protein